jgi:hypothetical protein
MRKWFLRTAVAALATAFAVQGDPPDAWAQDDGEDTFDHLQCFAIRDGLRRQAFELDLVPENALFVDEDGQPVDDDGTFGRCRVQLPARELCIAVSASNASDVMQVVPGAPPGPPAGEFLCYNLRCPESNARVRVNVRDPFGLRRIEVRSRPERLCAPATREDGTGATPTPGPEPTPTAGGEPTPTPGGGPTPTPTPGGPTPTSGEPTPTPDGEPTPTATIGSPSGAFVDGIAFF